MKNRLTLICCTLFLITSCSIKHSNFIAIDFQLEPFTWDSNPYKFSEFIQDSISTEYGTQIAAWDYSYLGDIENMHKMWDDGARERKELLQEKIDSFAMFKKNDAINYILEQAKTHKVVIINEGHHMPQHRVFTTQLLENLKEQGFNHLGLEAYFASSKADSILQTEGYPTLQSGYYTKEPQFGNLIRVAHEKGFKIFGYEADGNENGKEREILQAKNIQTYMEKYPGEKFLIHCGFDHGYEGALSNSWEKAMAGRLTEFTNIDPLTINQVIYSERGKKEYESPYYKLTDVEKPSVYINQNGQLFGQYSLGGYFDIAVFHPRSKKYNRPLWMQYGDRKEIEYSFPELNIECPCLVFAYKKGEKIGVAVPYDIQETNGKSVKLVLDKSDFQIVIWNHKRIAYKSDFRIKN